MRLERKRILAAVVGAMLSLVACGGGGAGGAAGGSTSSVHRGGTMNVLCTAPITGLDPATSKEADCDSYAYNLLYDRLVEVDDHGNVHPDLATSWTVSPDGRTYTFHLRQGVRFSDGTPVDAAAVRATLLRDRDTPGCPIAIYLKPISGIDANGPDTVEIHLSSSSEPLLVELGAADAGIVSPAAISKYGQDLRLHPVGSGPFTLKSWTPGSTAAFDRRSDYWQKGTDGKALPYLDGVVLNSQGDSSVALLNLRGGQTDYDVQIDPSDLESARSDQNVRVVETSNVVPYMLVMNAAKPPFDNKQLRLAVQAALDRAAIMRSIGYGVGYTSTMPFAKEAWYYVAGQGAAHDPKAAKKALAAAGYPNGLSVKLSVIDRSPDTQLAQIVQSQLGAVGIRVTIQTLERTTWVNTWYARQGEMGTLRGAASSASPPSSPIQDFNPSSINDYAGYSSPQMVSLMEQAAATTDKTKEKQILQEIAKLLVADAPYVVFGSIPLIAAERKNVHGVDGTTEDVTRGWLGASES